ncbi:hypothetical protein AWB74_08600 [Caballeronia arvi]|uniref:Uncharacterized protein n=1 Tax=Caballeronia arvi TaxID=1777135 RepID=A0A158L583_9BURK|nr:hypothetical protein AWB74_08600 [Caballeronia arvi]
MNSTNPVGPTEMTASPIEPSVALARASLRLNACSEASRAVMKRRAYQTDRHTSSAATTTLTTNSISAVLRNATPSTSANAREIGAIAELMFQISVVSRWTSFRPEGPAALARRSSFAAATSCSTSASPRVQYVTACSKKLSRRKVPKTQITELTSAGSTPLSSNACRAVPRSDLALSSASRARLRLSGNAIAL